MAQAEHDTVIHMPHEGRLGKPLHQVLTKLDKRKRPAPFYDLDTPCAPHDLEDTIDLVLELRRLLAGDVLDAPPQELLGLLLPCLEDLVLNDCRYTVANPRPFRPPCTLQALMIDIATLLVTLTNDPPTLYRIGLAMLPAFDAFPLHSFSAIKANLVGFFVNHLLPKLILSDKLQHPPIPKDAPVIQVQSPDDGRGRPSLTIDTRPLSESVDPPSRHDMYKDALLAPLLALLLPFLETPREGGYHVHRALRFMLQQKADLHLDLLQIIACNVPTRFHACQILFQYYFVSLGHLVIAKPLPKLNAPSETTTAASSRAGTPASDGSRHDDIDDMNDHVWYPHLFPPSQRPLQENGANQRSPGGNGSSSTPKQPHTHKHHRRKGSVLELMHDEVDTSFCAECYQGIVGFGLKCYQCRRNVHYSCYTDYLGNDDLDIMLYIKEGGMQKVVSPQFCHIPLQPRFVDLADTNHHDPTGPPLPPPPPATIAMYGHQFQLVNLFTLLLCACCRLPLWGISQQGYRCYICNRFVHQACLLDVHQHHCKPYQPFLESETRVSISRLAESLEHHFKDMIPQSRADLESRSYDHVAAITHVLTLQRHLLYYGVTSGCLLLDDDQEVFARESADHPLISPRMMLNDGYTDETPLGLGLFAPALAHCHDVLENKLYTPSAFFADESHAPMVVPTRGHYLLSFDAYLSHVCACMKARKPSHAPYQAYDMDQAQQQTMTTTAMRDWLMAHWRIETPTLAEIVLQHMRNMGLFERFDASPVLFSPLGTPATCIFPVPYAIDASCHVDTLLNAIDACLDDIDVSVNECALLLLTRRCWPDPSMPSHVCQQLMATLLGWILTEDDKLATIYATFAQSQQLHLPGVRQQEKSSTYGAASGSSRLNGTSTPHVVGAGNAHQYVVARQRLRDRYVAPWLAKVHKLDQVAFATHLRQGIDAVVDRMLPDHALDMDDESESPLLQFDLFFGCLAKLKGMGLTFSALDTVLEWQLSRAWDEPRIKTMLKMDQLVELRVLAKLFSGKPASGRSNLHDITSSFDIIANMLGQSASLERAIAMLELIVHMGTGIPSVYLAKFARALIQAEAPISVTGDFVALIWFQLVHGLILTPRAVILDVIGYLNETAFDTLKNNNETSNLSLPRLRSAQKLIRYSIVLTGYAYGCPVANLKELAIVPIHTYDVQDKVSAVEPELQADDKTAVLRCMLAYLQWDQLNVRQEIVKLFYGLATWGSATVKSTNLILNCMPRLIESVWELLSPRYDDSSDYVLQLLMKLLQMDAMPFHACVYKVMNDANWEIRYQGLDHLYGLFTKMDAAFQSKWLPLLSRLGPVFSSLVVCLWDNDENVRSKALALLRSFGTLHLNSAFRCWEAHFYSASDAELRPLIHMMIRLHALFPDWQVLQWECLLETLETKITLSASREASDTKLSGTQQAESENVTVLMMTLALQMLSHHVRIDMVQISRLKLLLVSMMGFKNPHRVLDGGEWKVLYGPIEHHYQDTSDPAQSAILTSCSRGLKLIMDSFAPLPAETVAKMAPEDLQRNRLKLAENSSPGVHFIDVVLKFFHADLTRLNPIVLHAWLEAILIVIYKHNILDRAYEQDLVFAMKQVIDLISHDIGEENKLLILEILHCLLRQSDHLTAMVLSKQIVVLGKLMTQAQTKRSTDPVFLRAKQFLKSAFSRFAAAGLFVLIFKNQTITEKPQQTDLFFVLRAVIDADDKVPDEDPVVYLRDQPVRDVVDKLMKQHQMDRKSFSAVLFNMSRYVETVHSHPYPENVLADYAGFLQLLVKYTQTWRRSDWDINPLFTMSAILLMEHPYHFQTLLPAMQALFVHGIRHCTVQVECVVHMMAAFASLANIPGIPSTNVFADIILDEIRQGLTQRQKLPKDTLLTALQLVHWDCDERYHAWYISIETDYLGDSFEGKHVSYFGSRIGTLFEPMVMYLKAPPNADQFTKKDFKSFNTVAHLLAWMCLWNQDTMTRMLSYIKLDETRPSLRFLSWFILCLLKHSHDALLERMQAMQATIIDLLVQLFDAVQVPYDQPDPGFAYDQTGEALVLSFLLLKIWTLVSLRTRHLHDPDQRNDHQRAEAFWLPIWPALRRFLCSIPVDTLISGYAGLTVWTWFLSLVQFLHTCRSDAVMTIAFDWCGMLDHLLVHVNVSKTISGGGSDEPDGLMDQFQQQVTRVRQMFTVPPIQVPAQTLVDQLYLELREIMRLQSTSGATVDEWDASGIAAGPGAS